MESMHHGHWARHSLSRRRPDADKKIEPGLLAKTIFVDLAPLSNLSERRAKQAARLVAKHRFVPAPPPPPPRKHPCVSCVRVLCSLSLSLSLCVCVCLCACARVTGA